MSATVGLGLFADLGTLAPNILMEAHLDYWSTTEDFVGGGGETSARDIALSARGKYAFSVPNSRIQPFAGAGLGIHFIKASVDIPDQNFGGVIVPGMSVEDSATRLGLDIGGGFSSPLNDRADILGEAWYGFVSDVNQFSVKLGFLYRLNI
jgi:opacity protein-like surface antigen